MTDDARPDPRIGTTVGAYRIERVLGRGGMGVVYLAQHLHLERPVALKVLPEHLAHDTAFRDRFIRESRMAASLRHPNIIPVYDAGEQDGVLFIAMQYVEGEDLAEVLRNGPLPPQAALAILDPIARALDHAHAAGVVHRDVKPGNIMLGPEGRGEREVYLTDFGLVREIDRRSRLTQTGTFVGTLDYAAPEMFQNTTIDGRADEYALACVLYECCTGDVPFPRESEGALIAAHLADQPPRPTEARADLPDELDAVIARGMAKAPAERFPTCSDLIAAAREALGEDSPTRVVPGRQAPPPQTVVAPPPGLPTAPVPAAGAASGAPPPPTRVGAGSGPAGPFPPKAPPEPRRRVWLFVVAGLVALAAIVTIVVLASGGGSPRAGESPTGLGTTAPATTPPPTTAGATTPPETSAPPTSGTTESPVAPGPAPVVEDTVGVGQLPFGVARDADSVWVANQGPGTVSRIDPASHRVIGTTKGVDNAFEIAAGLGSVWVTDQQQTVYLLSPLGGEPQAIPMKGGAFGVTVGFGSVWVTNDKADTVTRLDPSGHVEATIPTGHIPHGIAAGTDAVWIANQQGTVTRIDPATNSKAAEVSLNGDEAFQLAEVGGSVWVTNGFNKVFRIDAETNDLVDTLTVDGGAFDVAGGFGSVWLTKAGDNTFVRIDPATVKEADVVEVGTSPRLIAVGPEGLWVANGDSASVSLVHP